MVLYIQRVLRILNSDPMMGFTSVWPQSKGWAPQSVEKLHFHQHVSISNSNEMPFKSFQLFQVLSWLHVNCNISHLSTVLVKRVSDGIWRAGGTGVKNAPSLACWAQPPPFWVQTFMKCPLFVSELPMNKVPGVLMPLSP